MTWNKPWREPPEMPDFALATQMYDEATDSYVTVDLCQYLVFDGEKCGEPAEPGEVGCKAHLPWM